MDREKIKILIKEQRAYFFTGATREEAYRIQALRKLRAWILKNQAEIEEALKKDLGKSRTESDMCEIGMVLEEIRFMLAHIHKWMAAKTVPSPLALFPARSFIKPSPRGVVLIMSPWNYPFLLTVGPLVDALAAGNTAVLKPSAYSPDTAKLISRMVRECFSLRQAAVILGGRKENQALLQEHFDFIFFTGSQQVGRLVMESAARFLTPVVLELGGKSPCLVEKSADLKLAARRIVFGKLLNCGQTCVAPDFIYCDRRIKDRLLKEILEQIRIQYGDEPMKNPNYGRIVNEKHFDRLAGLIEEKKMVFGGAKDRASLRMEPVVLDGVTFSDRIMQEEIFGPILPVLTYESLEGAIANLQAMPHPLAFYVFSADRKLAERIMDRLGFGGGCINDTVMHLATSEMGFGGFGESGMGSYHGKAGFDAFTHYKSILDRKPWPDVPLRYQPYGRFNSWVIRRIMGMKIYRF